MRAAAGLAAAVLAACGVLQPALPDWVANRQPLEGCAPGIVEVDSPEAAAGEQCMLDAFRVGRGAELVTAGEMATGEPLTSYVRVHENGTVEMFLNLGDDPRAPGAWERIRCEELVPTEPGPDPVEGGVFTIKGCEQLPLP